MPTIGRLGALLVVVALVAMVTTTGAFSSVSASRTAQVSATGDEAALLQILPHDGPNGLDGGSLAASNGYAQLTSANGELEIDLSGFGGVGGAGPNLNATTDIRAVFNITNQGTQDVYVNVSDDDQDHTNSGVVTFYNATHAPLEASDPYGGLEDTTDANGNAVLLDPGETLVVSIYVDTTLDATLTGGDPLIGSITVYANSDGTVFNAIDTGPGGDN